MNAQGHALALPEGFQLKGHVLAVRRFLTGDGIAVGGRFAPVTLAGDFVITGKFATSAATGMFLFSGGTGLTGIELYINSTGGLSFWQGGAAGPVTPSYNDGKLHSFAILRAGTTVTVAIDDVVRATSTVAGDCTLDTLFHRSGAGFYYQGVLADVGIVDITNPVNADIFWPLKGGRCLAGAYELNSRAVLGPELLTNGGFDTDTTGWASLNGATLASVNGELRVTAGASTAARGEQVYATEVGKAYRVTGKMRDGGACMGVAVYARQAGSPWGVEAFASTASTLDTPVDFTFVATQPLSIIQAYMLGGVVGGETGYFDDLSIREAPHALVLDNVEPTDWPKFSKVGVNWLGPNFVVNGNFDTDLSGWVKSAAPAPVWEAGAARLDNTPTTDNVYMYQTLPLALPYQYDVNVLEVTGAGLQIGTEGGQITTQVTQPGRYKAIRNPAGGTGNFTIKRDFIAGVSTNALIDQLSARHILEKA